MTRVIFRLPVVASVVLAGSVLMAQAPGTPAQAPPGVPPKTDALGQKPTFRVTVDLVTNDVIVRDARGQFVADLTKERLRGLRRRRAAGRSPRSCWCTAAACPTSRCRRRPPPPEGIILPPSRPTNDASGRIFILFIDDLHLDFKNTARVRDLLKKIKGTLIHQGDMFGIVSSGHLVDRDRPHLRHQADRRGAQEGDGRRAEADRHHPGAGRAGGADRSPLPGARGVLDGRRPARQPVEGAQPAQGAHLREQRLRLQPVREVARRARRSSSRTGSARRPTGSGSSSADGTDDATTATGTDINDPSRSGQKFADADLVRELAELTRAANRANATIYTIDPRGLVGMPDLDDNVDPIEFQEYIANSINSLRVLAEQTGGIAVVNQNDFDKALKRIDAETSDYYMIGYYSTNPDPAEADPPDRRQGEAEGRGRLVAEVLLARDRRRGSSTTDARVGWGSPAAFAYEMLRGRHAWTRWSSGILVRLGSGVSAGDRVSPPPAATRSLGGVECQSQCHSFGR